MLPAALRSRTLVRGVLGWVLSLAVLRGVVLQPEHCGQIDAAAIETAVDRGIGWIVENQQENGAFLYRYDRASDEDLGGYHIVRHTGILVTLEQGATAGVAGAAAAADRGTAWGLDRLVPIGGGVALANDSQKQIDVGASSLWIVALLERRDRTGDDRHDELLIEMGRFVAGAVQDDGSVPSRYDRSSGELLPESWSKFYTGEAFWALARLHLHFPQERFDLPAARIAEYLPERDVAEEWWPPIPDHWAAYGYATMSTWPSAPTLSAEQRDYVRRQAGLQSLQIRYESTRTDSDWTYLTRGRPTLGAGLGTIGEAVNQWIITAEADSELSVLVPTLVERAECTAGVIVARQAVAGGDGREHGAWFQFDITQMDDQQHTLSALMNLPASAGGQR